MKRLLFLLPLLLCGCANIPKVIDAMGKSQRHIEADISWAGGRAILKAWPEGVTNVPATLANGEPVALQNGTLLFQRRNP